MTPHAVRNGKPQRVGVYGGAFDPPHAAHVQLAQTAIQHFELDVLHIIPTGNAWHKSRPLSTATHRVAMCALAFEPLPKVHIDVREIERVGRSYTLDTLREMKAMYPEAALYLLLGQDQYVQFEQWHRPREIEALAQLVVFGRGSAQVKENHGIVYVQSSENWFLHAHNSSAIRQAFTHAGCQQHPWLNPAVSAYIAQHQLYASLECPATEQASTQPTDQHA